MAAEPDSVPTYSLFLAPIADASAPGTSVGLPVPVIQLDAARTTRHPLGHRRHSVLGEYAQENGCFL